MRNERFAILIGMDNYKTEPLDYSVKDVTDLKEVLTKYCKFNEENIISITTSEISVIEQITQAVNEIGEKFTKQSDTLLFYFSGHGKYDDIEDQSLILFEDDTQLTLEEVVRTFIMPFKGRNHYVIIDACHSGNSLHFKEKSVSNKKERKLIYDSKELYFLFASEATKKAYQTAKYQNSLYTYFFIRAINDKENYDVDGFLTISAIDNYVRQHLSQHTEFVQIPTSESRSTGYMPFAFLMKEGIVPIVAELKPIQNMENANQPFDFEESLSYANRLAIQDQIRDKLQIITEESNFGDLTEKYDINKKSLNDGYLDSDILSELDRNIIQTARHEKLDAIHDLFEVSTYTPPRMKGLSSMFDALYGQPEPKTTYKIYSGGEYILTAFYEFRAKSVQYASGGLYIICYQAKYGFVMGKAFFQYRWNGGGEKISKAIDVTLKPYLLKQDSVTDVTVEIKKSIEELVPKLESWSKIRREEIEHFMKIAINK